MVLQIIDTALGAGDSAKSGGDKINDNFRELYAATGSLIPFVSSKRLVVNRLTQNASFNTGFKSFNSTKALVLQDNVTSLQVKHTFTYHNNTGTYEILPTGTATYTTSVKRPGDANWTPFRWNGALSKGAIGPGASTDLSDDLTFVGRKGETLLFRTYAVFSDGIVFVGGTGHCDTAMGDEFEYNAGLLADKTLGGAITTASQDLHYSPTAIVANGRNIAIALFGDSQMRGDKHESPGIPGDLGVVAPSLAGCAYNNHGTNSATLVGFLAAVAGGARRRVDDANAYCTDIFGNFGTNDLVAATPRTAAQIAADITSFCALFPGKRVFWTTILPRVTSTGSNDYSSPAVQVPLASEPERVKLNGLLRGGMVPGLSGVFDVAAILETFPDSGSWRQHPDGTQITDDGIHPKKKGNLLIRDSRVITIGRLLQTA